MQILGRHQEIESRQRQIYEFDLKGAGPWVLIFGCGGGRPILGLLLIK